MDRKDNEIERLKTEIRQLTETKDQAYTERNKLVAYLSTLRNSGILNAYLARHPENDLEWDDDWRWIVAFDTSEGQMSWHIHNSEFPLFRHLKVIKNYAWDGHTTEEKYNRLKAISK